MGGRDQGRKVGERNIRRNHDVKTSHVNALICLVRERAFHQEAVCMHHKGMRPASEICIGIGNSSRLSDARQM